MHSIRVALLALLFSLAAWASDISQPASASPYLTLANAASTGTTVNTLTIMTGAPSTAVIATTASTGGVVGITVAGAGTTGNATIQILGQAACVFSGATTAGDYVQISGVTGGDCVDAGSTYPTSGGQVIGRVLSTNGGAGTYQVDLFPAEIQPGSGGGSGTVTSVSFTGGIISVATPTTTPAFTVAGTSGGIPYFASGSTWASSTAGTAGDLILWGGAGTAPSDAGFLGSNVVRKDAANVGAAAMTLNMAASTVANALRVPAQAGATCGATGCETEDTTAAMYHDYTNGVDSLVVTVAAGSIPTNNHCAKFTVSGSTVTLADNGAVCDSAAGTVTSVSFTGGLISVATATTTPALTVAGTSGGVPYFSSASAWASSAAGTTGHLMLWGGAGNAPTDGGAPSTTTALSSITQATAGNTIANSTNAQVWNWALTGSTVGMTFGETTAASSTGNALVAITLKATSTAIPLEITNPSLGATPGLNTTDAVEAINTTAAATGAQQISPCVHWEGQGWKTTATAASEAVDWCAYVLPVQGAANPTSELVFASSINGGAYTTQAYLTTAAVLEISNVTAAGTLVLSSTNTNPINFDNGGLIKAQVSSAGLTSIIGLQSANGTKFTISGCSAGTTVGGPSSGSFVSGTTGTCTVVITINGATGMTAANGWACHAADLTTPANLISQSASTTTTCTVTGTTNSGDTITFLAMGF